MKDLGSPFKASRRDTRRERQPNTALTVGGVVTSLLLHGVLVGLIAWGALRGGEAIQENEPPMLEFEDVELLALGEEKPPNQLPRMANPAPPPPPDEEVVNLAEPEEQKEEPPEPEEEPQPEPDPEPEPEKKESPQPREKENRDDKKRKLLDQLSDLNNPNRPTNDDTPEGRAEGVAEGTVSDPAMANMMNTYQAQLMKAVVRYWELPKSLDEAEIKALAGQVAVYVRLSEEGHIVSYRFRSKSPNAHFNDSIERVLMRFQVSRGGRALPMPDDDAVKKAVVREGLNLKNWDASR